MATLFQNNKVYTYDEFGNTETITQSAPNDARTIAQTVEFDYTDDGRFVESKAMAGLTTSYTYDLTKGVVTSETASNGLTTHYFYDGLRRTKTQLPTGVESYSTLNWIPSGDKDAPIDALYYSYSKTSGIAPVWTYYNKSGQALRTVSYGYKSRQKIYTDMNYYDDGRLKRESLPHFSDATGDKIKWNHYYYDGTYDRLSKIVYADDTEQHKSYNDNLRTVTTTVKKVEDGQAISQESTVKINPLGQTIASTDDIGNTVTYNYDAAGRLKESFVASDHRIIFTYNLLGNRTSIDDPDAGLVTSKYNAFGQLMSQSNARRQTTSYLYDALGRVYNEKTTKTKHDMTLLDMLEYSYINSGVAIGQIDKVKQYNALVQQYSYDKLGRMNGKTEYVGTEKFTHSHTYDDYGRMATQTYPGGFTISNAYTSRGDLRGIVHAGDTIYKNTDFTAMGALKAYKLQDEAYTFSKGYDDYGRLETLNSNYQDLYYDYDPMGNLKTRTDLSSFKEETFGYDKLNRLTSVEYNDGSNLRPEFDKNIVYSDKGNILSKTDVGAGMAYGDNSDKGITAGPHALTSINTPMGYQPPDQTITYTYFNKVENLSQDNEAYTYDYTYGVDKQRRKTVYSAYNTSTALTEVLRTKYYLGNYEKVIENGVTKEYNYLSADAGLFGIFVKENGNVGTLKYVLTDHLGSLTGIVDATSGEVEDSASFDAWGKPRDSEDWTSAAVNRLFADRGFTGHEHLPEVFGLIDMNGRMYDPTLGRFLSPDPYVQASDYSQSFNRYSYCLNNPLMYTDPSGEILTGIGGSLLGNYIIGGLNNWINNDMSFSDAFSPSNGSYGTTIAYNSSSGEFGVPKYDGYVDYEEQVNAAIDQGMTESNYEWYQYFNDHNPGGDFIYGINQFNPLANLVNAGYTFARGSDSYGVPQTNMEGTVNLLSAVPAGMIGKVAPVSVGAVKQTFRASSYAAKSSSSAAKLSSNSVRLSTHLRQLEKYGQAGSRTLQNGRIRYYGNVKYASKAGTMIGRRTVREWNPSSSLKRTWMETLDASGNIRIARPQLGKTKGWHYSFDELGNYIGSWE